MNTTKERTRTAARRTVYSGHELLGDVLQFHFATVVEGRRRGHVRIVRPLGEDALVQVHQHRVLRLHRPVEHALHVAVRSQRLCTYGNPPKNDIRTQTWSVLLH